MRAELKVINTKHGLFFISNPNETIQKSLIQRGEFEYHLVSLASTLITNKPGLILDVGANIGTFCVPLANKFPSYQIVAFEPQRTVFHHCVSNVFLNQLSNVTVNRVAVSDRDIKKIRVPYFDVFENYSGSVSLDENIMLKRSKIPGVAEPGNYAENYDFVDVVQLDSVVSSGVSLMKIDVEGMELSVLKSAERILHDDSPIILLETWDLPDFADENKKIYEYLSSVGYQSFKLGNDSVACKQDDLNLVKLIEENGLKPSGKS